MKIIKILKAKIRNKNKIKDPLFKKRLDICNSCIYNSKYAEPENKNIKYYFWKFLNLLEYFCTQCGCEIKAKASEEMEQCPKGKWEQLNNYQWKK